MADHYQCTMLYKFLPGTRQNRKLYSHTLLLLGDVTPLTVASVQPPCRHLVASCKHVSYNSCVQNQLYRSVCAHLNYEHLPTWFNHWSMELNERWIGKSLHCPCTQCLLSSNWGVHLLIVVMAIAMHKFDFHRNR